MLKWGAGALLLLAAEAAEPPAEPGPSPDQYAQLIVREQIVVRVRGGPTTAEAAPGRWKEAKGPKCVAAKGILGAALTSQDSVDLIMRDRRRIRAKLESRCPALDYYYGFYITPNPDGMICEDRDRIRSRVGGQCGIDRFRSLEAVAAK
jgi:hypothetical protein